MEKPPHCFTRLLVVVGAEDDEESDVLQDVEPLLRVLLDDGRVVDGAVVAAVV